METPAPTHGSKGAAMLALLAVLALGACGGSQSCEGLECLTLSPYPAISIVRQPADVTAADGGSATFDVVVSSVSANPVSVTWQRFDTAVADWVDIAGQAGFGLTIAPVTPAHDGAQFRAVATAKDGQRLTSNAAALRLATAGDVAFADATFVASDWTTTLFTGGTGGVDAAEQGTGDGNPGDYRVVSLSVNAARAGETASVFSFHWLRRATYDPQAMGGLRTLDYARDERLMAGRGDGQATALALRQDGRVYFAVYGTVPDLAWVQKRTSGLVADDFTQLAPDLTQSPLRPDFSASGKPIEFGFLRANSTGVGGAGYTTQGAIDNWSVTLHR